MLKLSESRERKRVERVYQGEISSGAVTLQHLLSALKWCSYIEMSKELINGAPRKWLNKEIRHILPSGTIVQSDDRKSDNLMNKMVVNFRVFCPTMERGIVC